MSNSRTTRARYIATRPGGHPEPIKLAGRAAWVADRLIDAGPAGLSAQECPSGLRLAAFIFRLRRAGVSIDAALEPNSDRWGGHHSRYRLAAPLVRIGEGGA